MNNTNNIYLSKEKAIEYITDLRKNDIINFNTNYFLNELDNEIETLKNENAIILLRKDRDIYRLYFAYNKIDNFEELLKQLPQERKISLEIITKKDIDDTLFNCINEYLPYETTFLRSRCNIKDLRTLSKQADKIEYAILENLTFITENLNKTFNHFSSHLPEEKELIDLIKNKQVIITKLNNEIDSFIIYKINNNNINFDQWVSLSKNAKNGMRIIDVFYNYLKTREYKQIYNWVDTDNNKQVFNFHKFYGYKPDGTKDIYFINKTLKECVI